MTNYRLIGAGVLRLPDETHIPADPRNRDWVEYQAWLAEGNEPMPPRPPPATTLPETVSLEDRVAALEHRVDQLEGERS
jgi:hypothetical protein